jgi:hypothetical protein
MINIDIITTDTVTLIMPSWIAYAILIYMVADVILDVILWVMKSRLNKLKTGGRP